MIKDNILFESKVKIIITPQAQKVISSSKYSIDDFKKWALQDQKISLGGNNATMFLEKMYEVNANGGSTS